MLHTSAKFAHVGIGVGSSVEAMTKQSRQWNQRLYTIVWVWIAFKTLLPWLVFFRLTLEGESYRWGTQYFGRSFHSSGFERPDFLLIYALLAVGVWLLWLLRNYRFRMAGPLVFLFLGILAADAGYQLMHGGAIVFQGDTLGINIDISIPFYGLQFLMFGVAAVWWFGARELRPQRPPPIAGHRRVLAISCLAFVPIQIGLLVLGEPHGTTDVIGVVGTLLQWGVLAYAFFAGSNYY